MSKRSAQSKPDSAERGLHEAEVVHDVAAAHDEHPSVAERVELHAEIEVVLLGLARVEGELHDRDVRGRVHAGEDAPGAVVEPPAVVVEADPHRCRDLDDLLRELG